MRLNAILSVLPDMLDHGLHIGMAGEVLPGRKAATRDNPVFSQIYRSSRCPASGRSLNRLRYGDASSLATGVHPGNNPAPCSLSSMSRYIIADGVSSQGIAI